jgi:uncharacterized membrane-anchored protein YhcB (DUF1043 family)
MGRRNREAVIAMGFILGVIIVFLILRFIGWGLGINKINKRK